MFHELSHCTRSNGTSESILHDTVAATRKLRTSGKEGGESCAANSIRKIMELNSHGWNPNQPKRAPNITRAESKHYQASRFLAWWEAGRG